MQILLRPWQQNDAETLVTLANNKKIWDNMRVLQKNGFELESVRKKAVVKNNLLMNDYVWAKFRSSTS